jgi:hypothetical protein
MRKFQLAAVVTFGVFLFAGASLARAQDIGVNRVTVAFPFEVAGVMMPAGTYMVTPDDIDPNLLQIQSEDGRYSAFVGVLADDTTSRRGDCQFDFVRAGNRYYLSKIDDGEGDVDDLVMPSGFPANLPHVKSGNMIQK